MWCRNSLRIHNIREIHILSNCLQCLTNNGINNVILRHSVRRLFVSNAHECTIGDMIDQWSNRFKNEGISEPVESIEFIMAHIIGVKKVLTLIFCIITNYWVIWIPLIMNTYIVYILFHEFYDYIDTDYIKIKKSVYF